LCANDLTGAVDRVVVAYRFTAAHSKHGAPAWLEDAEAGQEQLPITAGSAGGVS
jgi:hypothetical protein